MRNYRFYYSIKVCSTSFQGVAYHQRHDIWITRRKQSQDSNLKFIFLVLTEHKHKFDLFA